MSTVQESKYIEWKRAKVEGEIAQIKADAKRGHLRACLAVTAPAKREKKGIRLFRPIRIGKKRSLMSLDEFDAKVRQALQFKQMQLSILQTFKGKSKAELDKMFDSTMAQMCPQCRGGIIGSGPHCKSGKDVMLFPICSLLFGAITKYEVVE